MIIKPVILGTAAYTFITFPAAVLWHTVLFESQYKTFGYFDDEPNFILGAASILLQGFVLAFLYNFTLFKGGSVLRALKYAFVVGVFFWSCHVLAFLAKQTINEPLMFALMESVYLFIQFGIFGVLLGLIYSDSLKTA